MEQDDAEKEEKRRRRKSRSGTLEILGLKDGAEDDKMDETVEEIPKPKRKVSKYIFI